MKAKNAINKQRKENAKAKIYIRATAAAVIRAQNAVRARKIAERMYAAKIKVERHMQRKAEEHQRRAVDGTIVAKKAFLKAKVATKSAMDLAALYKKQYYAALKTKKSAEKLTLHYNNEAAKMRHNTRVAYEAVKLANKKAAIAIAKAAELKFKHAALVISTKRAIKDTIHYKLLEKKAKAARDVANKKFAKANAQRKKLVSLTKKAHHATKHVMTMIMKLKVKHTAMVKEAKEVIAKFHEEHKEAVKNITKAGKAAVAVIELKLKKAEEAHDKQVNWYKIQIAKLNALHLKHEATYTLYVKKTKVVVALTAHYNKHIKITTHEITLATELTVKYVGIKNTHEKNTKISLEDFKKWTAKAKHAIKHRDEANAASVKAISLRVEAEAAYAKHHAAMLEAQKKSHTLRLQVVRYRKVVAKFDAQTKKNNEDTKFHQGKEAHWNRLAAIARAAAKKYLRHAAIEHKLRVHWTVIYKKRVEAEKVALAKAMKNNAAAAAMEARARVFAEAAKRATRLALREQKLRVAAEKRTKVYIARQTAAHVRYAKEEKLRFHFVSLARQADRKAAREWERRNTYVKEMKHAIKAMIASVAHRKKVVAEAMEFVTKQNALMTKANEDAEKSNKDKISAEIKATNYRKQRDRFKLTDYFKESDKKL